MYGVVATTADWPIIGEIATVLGILMNFIFNALTQVGIHSVGISIIVFTVIMFTFMLPLTIKQQRGMRVQQAMNPEIQKIQKKYAGKKDQATMMKQQEEMKLIYQKYGTSQLSSCLPMLVQMPILISLFPVIQNIPRYVAGVRSEYDTLVEKLLEYPGSASVLQELNQEIPFSMTNYDFTVSNYIYTLLSRFQDSTWQLLIEKIPELESYIYTTTENLSRLNSFLGINMSENPVNILTSSFSEGNIGGMALATLIPVAAGISQFISVKLQPQPVGDPDNPIARQMRTMIYFMPIISVFFGFTLPAGLGLYWTVSAIVRTIQMLFINRSLNKKTLEQLIAENQEKAAKKRARKRVADPTSVNQMATKATRNLSDIKPASSNEKEKSSVTQTNTAPSGGGSLADKANLVSRFNAGKRKEKSDEK